MSGTCHPSLHIHIFPPVEPIESPVKTTKDEENAPKLGRDCEVLVTITASESLCGIVESRELSIFFERLGKASSFSKLLLKAI